MAARRGAIDLRAKVLLNGYYRKAPTRFSYWFMTKFKKELIDEQSKGFPNLENFNYSDPDLLKYISEMENTERENESSGLFTKSSQYPPQPGDLRYFYGNHHLALSDKSILDISEQRKTQIFSFIYPKGDSHKPDLNLPSKILSEKASSDHLPCSLLDNIHGNFAQNRSSNTNCFMAEKCAILPQPQRPIAFYPEQERLAGAGFHISALYPISIFKLRKIRDFFYTELRVNKGSKFDFENIFDIRQARFKAEVDKLIYEISDRLTFEELLSISSYFEPWLPSYEPETGIEVSINDIVIQKNVGDEIMKLKLTKYPLHLSRIHSATFDSHEPHEESSSAKSEMACLDESNRLSVDPLLVGEKFYRIATKQSKQEARLTYALVYHAILLDSLIARIPKDTRDKMFSGVEISDRAEAMEKKARESQVFIESMVATGLGTDADLRMIWIDRITKSIKSGFYSDIVKQFKL
jgi:hypothetical protein